MSLFLAFLGVATIVIVTPGPDTAITIRNTLLGGRAGGICTSLGVACGQTIWAVATGVGLVTLLVASEPLFVAVKYVGAAYLVWLGLRSLYEAFRSPPAPAYPLDGAPPRPLPRNAAFRQGLISDLSNPKMAVFFASLLPQFVRPGNPMFATLLGLGLVFALMTFTWLTIYACILARVGDVLRRPVIRRAVEGLSGAVLVGLGLRLAAEQR